MKLFKMIRELLQEDISVDRHHIATCTLMVMTTNHNGAIPTEDVIAVFNEVEDRLTAALEARQKEIVYESEIIRNFLKRK